MEGSMGIRAVFGIAAVLAMVAGPAAAQDAMGGSMMSGGGMMSGNSMMSGGAMMSGSSMMSGATMGMMQGGEVMAIMPDGHIGKSMVGAEEAAAIMKMATPLDRCVMIVSGTDGKTYMVDTSSDDARAECEKMAM
jgi:hypothetical protein